MNDYRLNGVSISPAWNPKGRGEQSKSEKATNHWIAKGIAAQPIAVWIKTGTPNGWRWEEKIPLFSQAESNKRNHTNANEAKHVGIALGIVR